MDELWITEDSEAVRLMLERAFRRVQTRTARVYFPDGAAVLAHYEGHRTRPKLLLLDLQMPVMGGLEALQQLRAYRQFQRVPIVIFSADSDPESIASVYAHGAKLFLEKPEVLEDFEVIAKLVSHCADGLRRLKVPRLPVKPIDVRKALAMLE